jgi:hypothetical protein
VEKNIVPPPTIASVPEVTVTRYDTLSTPVLALYVVLGRLAIIFPGTPIVDEMAAHAPLAIPHAVANILVSTEDVLVWTMYISVLVVGVTLTASSVLPMGSDIEKSH